MATTTQDSSEAISWMNGRKPMAAIRKPHRIYSGWLKVPSLTNIQIDPTEVTIDTINQYSNVGENIISSSSKNSSRRNGNGADGSYVCFGRAATGSGGPTNPP